jgi:hypothetical protein
MNGDGPDFVLHEVPYCVAELELFRREMQAEQKNPPEASILELKEHEYSQPDIGSVAIPEPALPLE